MFVSSYFISSVFSIKCGNSVKFDIKFKTQNLNFDDKLITDEPATL